MWQPGGDALNGRAGRRADDVAAVQWSAEQLAVLRRAETLRALGRPREAEYLVAMECLIPSVLTVRHYTSAISLDLHRWYSALMGRPWDGSAASMRSARSHSARVRRRQSPTTRRSEASPQGARKLFCTCHLLVESLDDHPFEDELDDHTRDVGFATYHDAGSLDWQDDGALCCMYCDALLLPTEKQSVTHVLNGNYCGRYCCAKGYVSPCCARAASCCDCIRWGGVGGGLPPLSAALLVSLRPGCGSLPHVMHACVTWCNPGPL